MLENKYRLSSVGNALRLMDVLSEEGELGVSELAAALELNKTTTFRLLYTLESSGYIQKTAADKYRLGMKFAYYGAQVAENRNLIEICQPKMQRLSAEYGCNAHLGAIAADGVYICIYKEFGNSPLQIGSYVGFRVEAYLCGGGKVLLAFQNEERQRQYLDKYQYRKVTPCSIASRDELEKELAVIRQQGYGFDNEEYEDGVFCVAAPIFNWQSQCVAAISLSGAKERMVRNKYALVEALAHAVQEISRELGCKRTMSE